MINIKFPDGSERQYESGVTPLQIAESISSGLARQVLAASVNGMEWDISRPICNDGEIKLFKWDDPEGKHAFWHTSAHLLAEALQELYPGVQFGIGPAIENGLLLRPISQRLRRKWQSWWLRKKLWCAPIFLRPTL